MSTKTATSVESIKRLDADLNACLHVFEQPLTKQDASGPLAGVPVAIKKDTEEGLSTWVCGYVLLNDGEGSEDKAYDYINATLDPAVSSYIVSEWGYGHGNAKGMEAIDAETLKAAGYDDLASFVDKTLFQSPVPVELKQKMIAEFEKIKAGY